MGNGNGRTNGPGSIGNAPAFPRDPTPAHAPEFYEFGPFRLEPNEHRLLRGGEIVALTPKAFDTLHLLVRNSGHLLEKDELINMLWPDTFVEEGSLSNNIFLLRKALGDNPDYIETVPRRGYRFIGSVRGALNSASPSLQKSEEWRSGVDEASPKGGLLGPAKSAIPSGTAILRLTVAIVLVLSAALGWKIVRDRRFALAKASGIRSLAVLPLAILSGDQEQEYFCDGLTDTLTNNLGRLRVLRVISRYFGDALQGQQENSSGDRPGSKR